jgi:hypothetical protein
MFSTKDQDNDKDRGSCAEDHSGGWWFNRIRCHEAYLNGPYGSVLWKLPWFPTVSSGTLIRETVMMIKKN